MLLWALSGCAAPTEVLVHFDTDPSLRTLASTLRIDVADGSGAQTYTRSVSMPAWPATLPVVARSAGSSAFTVVGTLSLSDGRSLVLTARSHFVAGTRRELWLRFVSECVGIACTTAETCWSGACRPSCFEPAAAPPTDPSACNAADAGAEAGVDASVDAPGNDTGVCAEGASCNGGAGTCRSGTCCEGCWNGSACVTGHSTVACGNGGAACATCACAGDTCTAGACTPPPDRAATVVSVWRHACAMGDSSRSICWGADDRGQVGDGMPPGPSVPTWTGFFGGGNVHFRGAQVCTMVPTYDAHACWGSYDQGALGMPGSTDETRPRVAPAPSSEWDAPIAAGGHYYGLNGMQTGADFGCAMVDPVASGATRQFWCWGTNALGQLARPDTVTSDPHMVEVMRAGHSLGPRAFALGTAHALLIDYGPGLYAWGNNADGQLAMDPTTTVSRTVQALTIPFAGTGTGESIYDVSAGDHHSCVQTFQDGGAPGFVYCWGRDGDWLGPHSLTGAWTDPVDGASWQPRAIASPDTTTPWTGVSTGFDHTCATAAFGGGIWCWGDNATGALGSSGVTHTRTPTRVDTTTTEGNRTFTQVAAGHGSTCAVAMGGAVYCWGDNATGVLGVAPATRASASSPVRVCLPPP